MPPVEVPQSKAIGASILNDQMALQSAGTLLMMLCKSKGVSQALLFHEKLYPMGLGKKQLLLDKLLKEDQDEQDREQEEAKESEHLQAASAGEQEQVVQDPKYTRFLKMKADYSKRSLFQQCPQYSAHYHQNIVEILTKALQSVDLTGDLSQLTINSKITRIFTFKSLCTLLLYLTSNLKS